MTTLEAVLLLATVPALFVPFLQRTLKRTPRWMDFVPAALLALGLLHLAVDGFHMYMIVAYVMAMVLFLQTTRRLRRATAPVQATRAQIIAAGAGSLLGVLGLVCGLLAGPIIASGNGEDLSRESWSSAFDHMHAILTQRYGFTEWKQVDWEALHAEYAPMVAAAEQAQDSESYQLALREYLFSIPDGHLGLDGCDPEIWRESVGGGFGLELIELDDGSVIAHRLSAGGPAANAGMTWGAEILAWNEAPIHEALEDVTTIWVEVPPATQEGRRIVQQTLLTRARIGAQASITFHNTGETGTRTATLTAFDDGMQPLYDSIGWWDGTQLRRALGEEVDVSATRRPPEFTILPEGYGYLRIYHVIPEQDDPDFPGIVQQAVTEFVAQDVPGIIIDVRGNPGGIDTLVAEMMGHFFHEADLYETMYFQNWLTGLSLLDAELPVPVEPKQPHYGGPLAILIDQNTRSSGEGFPLLARRLLQGSVVGIYGTHGSFGMCCASIRLPGGLELHYPAGQSRDGDHRVQLDSNQGLQGGITPDVRVPLTRDTAHAMFVEGEDLVLQYAVIALQER